MLWVFYFIKCYSKTGQGCSAAGIPKKGDVDPKIWNKHVWPTVYSLSLSDLFPLVVSLILITIITVVLLTLFPFLSDYFQ